MPQNWWMDTIYIIYKTINYIYIFTDYANISWYIIYIFLQIITLEYLYIFYGICICIHICGCIKVCVYVYTHTMEYCSVFKKQNYVIWSNMEVTRDHHVERDNLRLITSFIFLLICGNLDITRWRRRLWLMMMVTTLWCDVTWAATGGLVE